MELEQAVQAELERALRARAKNNEGQARVCARRAAGIAARPYLARRAPRAVHASAYDLLRLLQEDPALPAEMRSAAEHLTLRVTEEFKLPIHADLVEEAQKLCQWLLNEGKK
ncbi:MAG: hypothetical protein Fur002_17490 [Anaerolineales bacterium]